MISLVITEMGKRNIFPNDYYEKLKILIYEEKQKLEIGKSASLTGKIVSYLGVFLGFIGVYMGYQYSYSKVKSKYNNEKFYVYNVETRQFGGFILFFSLSMMFIGFFYKISK